MLVDAVQEIALNVYRDFMLLNKASFLLHPQQYDTLLGELHRGYNQTTRSGLNTISVATAGGAVSVVPDVQIQKGWCRFEWLGDPFRYAITWRAEDPVPSVNRQAFFNSPCNEEPKLPLMGDDDESFAERMRASRGEEAFVRRTIYTPHSTVPLTHDEYRRQLGLPPLSRP